MYTIFECFCFSCYLFFNLKSLQFSLPSDYVELSFSLTTPNSRIRDTVRHVPLPSTLPRRRNLFGSLRVWNRYSPDCLLESHYTPRPVSPCLTFILCLTSYARKEVLYFLRIPRWEVSFCLSPKESLWLISPFSIPWKCTRGHRTSFRGVWDRGRGTTGLDVSKVRWNLTEDLFVLIRWFVDHKFLWNVPLWFYLSFHWVVPFY